MTFLKGLILLSWGMAIQAMLSAVLYILVILPPDGHLQVILGSILFGFFLLIWLYDHIIPFLLLGMVIQAFIAGTMDIHEYITISAGQQMTASVLYVIQVNIWLLIDIYLKKKRHRNFNPFTYSTQPVVQQTLPETELIHPEVPRCKKCDAVLPSEGQFCTECGEPIAYTGKTEILKNRRPPNE